MPGGKKHFISKQFIGWTRPGNVQQMRCYNGVDLIGWFVFVLSVQVLWKERVQLLFDHKFLTRVIDFSSDFSI